MGMRSVVVRSMVVRSMVARSAVMHPRVLVHRCMVVRGVRLRRHCCGGRVACGRAACPHLHVQRRLGAQGQRGQQQADEKETENARHADDYSLAPMGRFKQRFRAVTRFFSDYFSGVASAG